MRGLIIFACLLAVSSAKVVHFDSCSGVDETKCSISEVRIETCKPGRYCGLEKKKNATITFDFVPKFSTSSLQTAVYGGSNVDIKFTGMGSNNGCDYTECPVVADKAQVFSYTLYIGKLLPSGYQKLKWMVWNNDNESDACCFTTSISIKK